MPVYFPGVPGPVVRPLSWPSSPASAESGTGTLAAAGAVLSEGTAAPAGSGTLAAAATTAPALTFAVAIACGSSTTAGTKVTPSGWTPLHTVSASNGVDHSGDCVLAAAVTTTSSSTTISATATTAEAMSGQVAGYLVNAPDPRPAGLNPNWPYVLVECAFGSGYMTPPDQMTWTNIQSQANGRRLRSDSETTGAEYELAALEASELTLVLDNPDGWLSPGNPSSPWAPFVVPGVPIRIRAIPPASTGCNAWTVIQRNVERWPQSWDPNKRGLTNATGTDIWSVVAKTLPTAYRAEVLGEPALYAAWFGDDPATVPLPVSLVNAAPGNASPLRIVTSPAGLASTLTTPFTAAYSAVQDFAANSGWMYGDPASSSWQQSGNGSGTTGRYLMCQDSGFPPLSGGVTIEHWFNLAFLGTGSGSGTGAVQGPYTQPPSTTLVLWEIASATAPLASLQVSTSGALQLVTWSGSTPTTHAIYSGSDVRNTTWTGVTVTLTQTGWQAWVNGGVVAFASGSASMGSSWSYFLAGAGTGNSGGGASPAGIPNCAHSSIAVYGSVLPAPRVMAHYMAAYAGFGQLPAPALSAQFISQSSAFIGAYAPDGNIYTGAFFGTPISLGLYQPSLAAEAAGTGGGLTSGPAVPESVTIQPPVADPATAVSGFNWLTASGQAVPQYAWYTSQGAGSEKLAATTLQNYLYVNSYASGAAMPSVPSALGDTVQQRIERLLAAGLVTTPARAIDAATSPVVAALDTGGQACGSAVQNIAQSDGGLLAVDNMGCLFFFSKPHLASMPVLWVLGEDVASGMIPYLPDAEFDTDPQQCRNDIQITQASVAPDAAGGGGGESSGSGETSVGLTFGPSAALQAAMVASQLQNGPQGYSSTNYLQSTASIQAFCDWLGENYGSPRQRISNMTVDAAPMTRSAPQSWLMMLGANCGDVMQAFRSPPGQPSFNGIYRISQIRRKLSFGEGGQVTAAITVLGDYWTDEMWT